MFFSALCSCFLSRLVAQLQAQLAFSLMNSHYDTLARACKHDYDTLDTVSQNATRVAAAVPWQLMRTRLPAPSSAWRGHFYPAA
jgi:hypothetical protein